MTEPPVGGLDGVTLVYVLGPGHCGSTLLSLLLNGHPRVLAVGEIATVADFTISPDPASRKNRELSAPIWVRTAQRWEEATGYPLRQIDIRSPRGLDAVRWTGEQVDRWADRNALLLSCLAQESGADVLVDSSKFAPRLYLLRRSGRFRLKVIDLRRDGRAVLYSYRRKGRSFRASWGRWASPVIWSRLLRPRFAPEDWLTVRYEDLARAPADTLDRTCGFLGIDFTPGMLRFHEHESVAIGGNAMRYGRDETIRMDDEWKAGRLRRDRVAFALVGSVVNRLQGY